MDIIEKYLIEASVEQFYSKFREEYYVPGNLLCKLVTMLAPGLSPSEVHGLACLVKLHCEVEKNVLIQHIVSEYDFSDDYATKVANTKTFPCTKV
jgi:hypothetical protein